MLGYRPAMDAHALLVSGGRGGRVARPGHGAFARPGRVVLYVPMAVAEAQVAEKFATSEGTTLRARAAVAFKVGDDAGSVIVAGDRFRAGSSRFADQHQMKVMTVLILASHLRSVIGSTTAGQALAGREQLVRDVLAGCQDEMARVGLAITSLRIDFEPPRNADPAAGQASAGTQ